MRDGRTQFWEELVARASPRRTRKPGPREWEIPQEQLLYIATLVNPVDHRPYAAVWHEHESEVLVVTPTETSQVRGWGQGFFSEDDDPAPRTDCPRSHVPKGVAVRGRGLGLMLYSGMSLTAAYANSIGKRAADKLGMPAGMRACISSSSDQRSRDATEFWRKQVAKGLAEEEEGGEECDDRDGKAEVDIEEAGIDESWVEQHLESDGGEIRSVRGSLSGTVYYEFCRQGDGAQILNARSVFTHGLVIHWNEQLDGVYEYVVREEGEPDWATILPEISFDEIHEPRLVEWFLNLMRERGLSENDIHAFLVRNKLMEQIPLLGREPVVISPRMRRNPRHSAAWHQAFGALVDVDD